MILHPFLIALFPILFLYGNNVNGTFGNVVWIPAVVTLCLAGLVWGICRVFIKDTQRVGILVSLFFIFFFSYGRLYWGAETLYVADGNGPVQFKIHYFFFALALFFVFFLAQKAWRHPKEATQILNVAAVCLVLLPIYDMAAFRVKNNVLWQDRTPAQSAPMSRSANADMGEKPNIYYIILDAYGGDEILNGFYGFDNSFFLDGLREKGFYIADRAKSNYEKTPLSLGASLNLDYIDNLVDEDRKEVLYNRALSTLAAQNTAMDFVKKQGYTTAAFSTGYKIHDIRNVDRYHMAGRVLNSFQIQLLDTTPIPDLLHSFGIDAPAIEQRKAILNVFDTLADTAQFEDPTFIFAHIVAPHAPYVFGPNGEPRSHHRRSRLFDPRKETISMRFDRESQAYLDQLTFINKKAEVLIDTLLTRSQRPTVIILQGDHGPRFAWRDEGDMSEFLMNDFSILNAYYFPDGDYDGLSSTTSPVNSFRLVFNKYFGTAYDVLEDKNFGSTNEPYRLTELTHWIEFMRYEHLTGQDWISLSDKEKLNFISASIKIARDMGVDLPQSQTVYTQFLERYVAEHPSVNTQPLSNIFAVMVYKHEPGMRKELQQLKQSLKNPVLASQR